MSIVMRVFLSMGVLVTLSVLVGGFGSYQTRNVADIFIEYRKTAKGSLLATDVAEDMFEARIASLKYRASKDASYIDELSQNTGEIVALEAAFAEVLLDYPDSPAVEGIIADLRTYEGNMRAAYAVQNERDVVVSQTEEIGRKARQQLTEIMETALEDNDAEASSRAGIASTDLMLARFYLEKYLVDNKPEDAERSATELTAARQGMTRLLTVLENPRRRNLAMQTIADIDAFGELSTQVTELIEKRNALYAEMDAIGPEILIQVEAIQDQIVARQDTLGPLGQARAANAIVIVLSVVALGVVLGAILAFVNGRQIKRKLAKVTADMTELANGNLDVALNTQEQTLEVRQMNDAMVVFQNNAREARSLDQQMKEKAAADREQERAMQEKEAARAREEEEARQRGFEKEKKRAALVQSFQSEIEQVLGRAADGDFAVRMDEGQSDDDMRNLACVINELLRSIETNISDVVTNLNALAQGDLGVTIDGKRKGSFARMQGDFNSALQELGATMQHILGSSSIVAGTASELESASLIMSKRGEETASSIEETSAAIEEIASSIKQVVGSAKAANDATRLVQEKASESRVVADKTEASIQALTDASAKINSVVQVIEDIAFQINLLALNAGVEAARAGEAGRGFSVVASEVRALAQRSQEAVQEIGTVIQENNRTVDEGVRQVAKSRKTLEDIASEVEVTAKQIADITMAVEEQSSGIEEVRSAVTAIDNTSQENAASLEELTASNISLSQEATALNKAVSQFRGLDADAPKGGIATATHEDQTPARLTA
ncbi:MAG: methyl-accepting chemotaxis protein [Pseudomonadota bacterium]